MTRPSSLWRRSEQEPGKLAVVMASGRTQTYASFAGLTNQLSTAIRDRGLAPGDSVAAVLTNRPELLAVYAACVQSGLYYVPVNTHLSADEIAYILKDSEAALIFGDGDLAQTCVDAADSAGIDRDRRIAVGWIDEFVPIDDLVADVPNHRPEPRQLGSRMPYTSGTTGHPKGVRWRLPDPAVDVDDALGAAAASLFSGYGLPTASEGVHLVTGPLHHQGPLAFAAAALMLGNSVVVMERWSAAGMLSLVERHRVSTTHVVPTMFHRLLQLPDDERLAHDLSSLRKVLHAAAPCPIDTKRKMIDWLGPIVDEYYGASEGGGTYVSASEWLARPGTVGRPKPGSGVKVLDDDGEECQPNEIGTVYLKITQPFEYFHDEKKTAAACRDGYFNVGDVGYLDEDGYLYLQDRKADMVISGGVNIYPAEIENVLLTHPAVADAAAFGIPNAEWGEEVKAVVQLRVGSHCTEAELIDFCRERLAHYKCPKSVDLTPELPRMDNGKLYKRKLRDPYWQTAGRLI